MTASHRYLFNGETCGSLDEIFLRYGDASHNAHIFLDGRNGMHIQSVPVGNGLYYCEVGDSTHGFVCPHEMMVEELKEQFRRFDSGEDFSFVAEEWNVYEPSLSPLPAIIKWIVVAGLMDIVIILAFTGFPASQMDRLSCMLNTFANFLLS